jgi:large subunit ribosomal protein L13
MKTYSAKPSDVVRKWYVIDASDVSLGRLSTRVANLLMGKGKPQFTHHIDTGDFVVIINAANLVTTGKKTDQKMYYHHSHFPGGLKETTLGDMMIKDPTHVINHAVRGMIPDNKLRDDRLKRLKIYTGMDHNHEAQKPEIISLKDNK